MKISITTLLALTVSGAFSAPDLWMGFANPPMAARPWCYHWWVNGNVDKTTLTADLEDMKALGFGGVNMIDSRGYWDNSPDHVKVPPVDIVWGPRGGMTWSNTRCASARGSGSSSP